MRLTQLAGGLLPHLLVYREPGLPVMGCRILRAMDQEENAFVGHFREWGDQCSGSFDKCVAPSSSYSEGWGHRTTDCHGTDYYVAAPTGHDRS